MLTSHHPPPIHRLGQHPFLCLTTALTFLFFFPTLKCQICPVTIFPALIIITCSLLSTINSGSDSICFPSLCLPLQFCTGFLQKCITIEGVAP
ncbi:uncharacterized protein BKA55DRAFT_256365 [Fusarium redolens]|uniref:Uncharacterized protein n=1 Tax=Fusarium redolens TaxID=48865 RepID=A0A9P9FWT5_FUSRE|nr:uncharacterized protein BKA55DRAFT_256365 [Fusarium redolens]KAH7210784.1 hypothetical protein BKA55DRAFT_256365 [Fusarium redolens]